MNENMRHSAAVVDGEGSPHPDRIEGAGMADSVRDSQQVIPASLELTGNATGSTSNGDMSRDPSPPGHDVLTSLSFKKR